MLAAAQADRERRVAQHRQFIRQQMTNMHYRNARDILTQLNSVFGNTETEEFFKMIIRKLPNKEQKKIYWQELDRFRNFPLEYA